MKTFYLLTIVIFLNLNNNSKASNFITQWDLSITGSGATQISFGIETIGAVNYTWETVPANNFGSGTFNGTIATLTGLPAGSVIRLAIDSANFKRINNAAGTDRSRLILVEQWGSCAWSSMANAFTNCINLQIAALDVPNLQSVSNMYYMFSNCTALNSPSNINSWNTSTITNMTSMFEGATSFNMNIGSWNTSLVNYMGRMFYAASSFNKPLELWDTELLTDVNSMFREASSFNQPLSTWNTNNITDFSDMFYLAASFNQNIGFWNLTQVAASPISISNFSTILYGCGIDCNNYTATLIGWEGNPNTPDNVTLETSLLQYTSIGIAARNRLIGINGWIINGDNLVSSITPVFATFPDLCGNQMTDFPTTSLNGITGTWSSAFNTMSTYSSFVFTPNQGCGIAVETILTKKANLDNYDVSGTSTCNGTLTASMVGGTMPYSYTFNYDSVQIDPILYNACAGFNWVTITDAAGCSDEASYYLPFDATPIPLIANILVSPTSTVNLCDGSVEVSVISGTPPYSFNYSTGNTNEVNDSLCTGLYNVTIIDAAGTTLTLPFLVASDSNTFVYDPYTDTNAYLGGTVAAVENCNIDYNNIDSVTVNSAVIFSSDSCSVIWNIYSSGLIEQIAVNYPLAYGVGCYIFTLDIFCPTKSNGKFLKAIGKLRVADFVELQTISKSIITIYPNPFSKCLTISLNKIDTYAITLLDLTGRVLLSKTQNNTNHIELSDLDLIEKGEYLLQIIGETDKFTHKVIK
jgi:surface protein